MLARRRGRVEVGHAQRDGEKRGRREARQTMAECSLQNRQNGRGGHKGRDLKRRGCDLRPGREDRQRPVLGYANAVQFRGSVIFVEKEKVEREVGHHENAGQVVEGGHFKEFQACSTPYAVITS